MSKQTQNMMYNYVINPYSGEKLKAYGPIAKRLFKQGWIINDIDGFNEQLEAYELLDYYLITWKMYG